MVTHSEALHTVGLAQALLDLVLQVTALGLTAWVVLQVLHVSDRHLNDLGLLNSASALLQVGRWDEAAEVGQAVVHPVPASLFNDPVRHWILGNVDVVLRGQIVFSWSYRLSLENTIEVVPLSQMKNNKFKCASIYKGGCQKQLSGFFPLRDFWQNNFPLRG